MEFMEELGTKDGQVASMPYSILLATYNGQRFIGEFLESCQFIEDADLIVRDDASTDNTVNLLQYFAGQRDVPLHLCQGENLGAKENFASVWERLEKPYFFFADQDDIWEKDKVAVMLQCMREQEEKHGKDTPILVYSDASIIDAEGHTLHASLFQLSSAPQGWNESFKEVLSMPNVPGCVMLGNIALAEAALPMPEEALLHDGWCLLVASALGVVKEIPQPLVRYRQHEANVSGVQLVTWKNIIPKFFNGLAPKRKVLRDIQVQAGALLKHCGHKMSSENKKLCTAWAKAADASWLTRRIIYLRYGFKRVGLSRRLILWFCG